MPPARVLLHALPVLQVAEHAARVHAAAHAAAQAHRAPAVAGALLGVPASPEAVEVHMALELALDADAQAPLALLQDRLAQTQAVYPALHLVGCYTAPSPSALPTADDDSLSPWEANFAGQLRDHALAAGQPDPMLLRFGTSRHQHRPTPSQAQRPGQGQGQPPSGGAEPSNVLPLTIYVTSFSTLVPLPDNSITIVAANAERIAVDAAAHARPPPPEPGVGELPSVQADLLDEDFAARLDASSAALDQLGRRVQALAQFVQRLVEQTSPAATDSAPSLPLAHVQPDLPHDLLRSLATIAAALPSPTTSHHPGTSAPPSSDTNGKTYMNTATNTPPLSDSSAPVAPDWLSFEALRSELQSQQADVLLVSQLAQLTTGWGELQELIGKFELSRQTDASTLNMLPPQQGDVTRAKSPTSSTVVPHSHGSGLIGQPSFAGPSGVSGGAAVGSEDEQTRQGGE